MSLSLVLKYKNNRKEILQIFFIELQTKILRIIIQFCSQSSVILTYTFYIACRYISLAQSSLSDINIKKAFALSKQTWNQFSFLLRLVVHPTCFYRKLNCYFNKICSPECLYNVYIAYQKYKFLEAPESCFVLLNFIFKTMYCYRTFETIQICK